MSGTKHWMRDSDDFWAGYGFAAHILRHAVNAAHGGTPGIPADMGYKLCCQRAILQFALGIADGMQERVGMAADADHEHTNTDDEAAADIDRQFAEIQRRLTGGAP